ncbi:hypothetical protein I7I53_07103 [Histoplasma capsulatum var. duboisii H88]|uniref:Secreted protein n=1 Tax=Ajellomyces capsulatus (strain H88) TaxID=544711 RepID=A0A8A1LCR7_AJEC8|nr:hypothetical protein I7I53_07103 [Histoplasma capsulatum var. duboisii H88]
MLIVRLICSATILFVLQGHSFGLGADVRVEPSQRLPSVEGKVGLSTYRMSIITLCMAHYFPPVAGLNWGQGGGRNAKPKAKRELSNK